MLDQLSAYASFATAFAVALLTSPITMAVGLMFVGFILLDALWRPRDYPDTPGWRVRGLLAFLVYLVVSAAAPLAWDAWLAEHRLIDLTSQPLWLQIGLGLLVFELGMYAWHRCLHGSDVLWRHLHQTHHSAERIDVFGAFWFHPLDMIGWSLQGSLCLVWAVGLSVEAVVPIVLAASFMAMFTHANVRTPRWLGWFIARPEMHAAHHERGVHRSNYCDLPMIDMIFGTYRNPKEDPAEAGFFDGASARLGDLLVGRKLA